MDLFNKVNLQQGKELKSRSINVTGCSASFQINWNANYIHVYVYCWLSMILALGTGDKTLLSYTLSV